HEDGAALPLLSAFHAAKRDLAAGASLPPEVLEGIRSGFHREVPKEEVLRLTARSLTQGQTMALKRRTLEAGADVRFDPTAHDPVKLYLYAFEMGMTPEIVSALRAKARRSAERLSIRFGSIGILLDA